MFVCEINNYGAHTTIMWVINEHGLKINWAVLCEVGLSLHLVGVQLNPLQYTTVFCPTTPLLSKWMANIYGLNAMDSKKSMGKIFRLYNDIIIQILVYYLH